MKHRPKKSKPSERGFALIVTLMLMVLLSIIAVGLLSLSTISLRGISTGSAAQIAQANARLGLLTALGELQKHLGPDQRISARGISFAADTSLGITITDDTPQAWWVGVANGDPDEVMPDGQSVEWLISGRTGTTSADLTLNNPVTLYSEKSLDLTKYTAGQEIQAGRVAILDSSKDTTGYYAYFVDDEGMKARLAPSNTLALNSANAGRGLLPSGADLGDLNELVALKDADSELLARMNSIQDLPLVGTTKAIISQKHFDYTTNSFGVLSDTRRGGLRKDLTIAFENSSVFSNVFPSTDKSKYLLLDSDRLSAASDLQTNGYIHWDIFKDYYNLKKYIQTSGGTEYLVNTLYEKAGFTAEKPTADLYIGKLGPHAMKPGGSQNGHPYGDYSVSLESTQQTAEYKHSPVSPVLSFLQMNAWLDPRAEGPTLSRKYYLIARTQLWTGNYNPYNIGIQMEAKDFFGGTTGPRIMNFPQAVFTVPKYADQPIVIFSTKRESNTRIPMILEPGRSHVLALNTDVTSGTDADGGAYTPEIRAVVGKGVFQRTTDKTTEPVDPIDVQIDFVMNRPTLLPGGNEEPGSREVAQFIYSPIAWDSTTWTDGAAYPGKRFTYSLPKAQLLNTTKSLILELRTTQESGSAIRPLIDSNIRAPWVNPKWDAGLGLAAPAAYSVSASGVAASKDIEMSSPDDDPNQGYSYMGPSHSASDGFDRVILYDVPREDLLSLGQLQHANAGRFSYEPSYIVGNSYANPRIPRDEWKTDDGVKDEYSNSRPAMSSWQIPGTFNLYDASYLVNEVLWDSYIFTTIPQTEDNFSGNEVAQDYDKLLSGELLLPNPRFIPYEPEGSTFDEATLKAVGNATSGSFFHNAGHLLVDGAFNIHSTSVDAWEAFLSSTRGLPVEKIDDNGAITGYDEDITTVRFPRVKANYGDAAAAGETGSAFWDGFRELTQTEVRDLAAAIVDEIKSRGPFHGLAEFVNRKLEDSEEGDSGTLQAALDSTVNSTVASSVSGDANHSSLPSDQTQAAGFPGQLLQGDILQALSPYMSARSDTFTIRAYGEALDATGNVAARAWCEATVQRLPDAMPSTATGTTALTELASPNSPFGRRFVIRTFRWLNKDEV